MDWLHVVILGVLQGITEFLPVSSSGHLVVVEALLGQEPQLSLNIILHAGTLLAILVFYRREVWRLVGDDRCVVILLVVATVPAAVAGLVVKRYFQQWTESPLLAGVAFIVTGILLLMTLRRQPGQMRYEALGYRAALLIGLIQAVAVLPGISRSGVTIVAGLALGLRRESAAAFSFLLAIPIIAGAGALELFELYTKSDTTIAAGQLGLGVAVAFIVGLASLWWLVRWLQQGRLHWFGLYCIPLGLAVIAWQLVKP